MADMFPHIEKFMPAWVCVGSCLFFAAMFLVVVIVMATSRKREDDETR